MERYDRQPKEIWLDLAATDDPLPGNQQGQFFHGYYGHTGYLPLSFLCGEPVLCAGFARAYVDPVAGSVKEWEPIVTQMRSRWPEVRMIIRGDARFGREAIIAWCERSEVHDGLGLCVHPRLVKQLEGAMDEARVEHETTGESARRFRSFDYSTRRSWGREQRVIGKAGDLARGDNPRFVVASLLEEEADTRHLYEDVYCARGDRENRMKEPQLGLFAERISRSMMQANQLRLSCLSFAYVLTQACRQKTPTGTQWARLQCTTIRLHWLKMAAQVHITTRRVWLPFSESCTRAEDFEEILARLHRVPPCNRLDSLRVTSPRISIIPLTEDCPRPAFAQWLQNAANTAISTPADPHDSALHLQHGFSGQFGLFEKSVRYAD